MPAGVLHDFLRRLRGRLRLGERGELLDADLLERFVVARDEAAFEMLLWRHGPMVLGVCRRLLSREEDREDAFQATFLTLARKAASIRRREALAGWLYRTAHRIALDVRTLQAHSAVHERSTPDLSAVRVEHDAAQQAAQRELLSLLDTEIERLPRKYRDPIVLCHLEGKTQEEAARELGWAKGTVSTRLLRARELLRQRLHRHGEAVSSSAVLPALTSGALPLSLAQPTLRAAFSLPTSTAVAGVSARALVLTERALYAMSLKPWKIAVALVLGVGPGVGWFGYRAVSGTPGGDERAQVAQTPPNVKPKTDPPVADQQQAARDEQQPQAKKEKLRYDDKSFEEWRAFLQTELKAERLVEGLHAMGVFGAHGYAKDAAAAVLDLALKYVKLDDKTKESQEVIFKAQQSLGRIGAPAVPILLEALKDRDRATRYFAVTTLNDRFGKLGSLPRSAVPPLLRAVLDEDLNIRISALQTVFLAEKSLAAIEEAIQDEKLAKELATSLTRLIVNHDPGVTSSAFAGKVLRLLGEQSRPSVSALISVLKDRKGKGYPSAGAIVALGEMAVDAKTVVPVLTEAFESYPTYWRPYISTALARFGSDAKSALPTLLKAQAEVEAQLSPKTLKGFSKDGFKDFNQDALKGFFKGTSGQIGTLQFVLMVATETIRSPSRKDSTEILVVIDRTKKATSYEQGQQPRALALLAAFDRFPANRVEIAKALGRMPREAITALPVLEQALESSDPELRRAAAAAISNIRSAIHPES